MTYKLKISEGILNLILLLPITTLLQKQFVNINRICFAVILIFLFLYLFKRISKSNYFLICGVTIGLHVWSFMVTDGVAHNINEYFYFLFFVFFGLFVIYRNDFLTSYCDSKRKYILAIVIIWNLLVFISLFDANSYSNGSFISYTGDVFRIATSATFVLVLLVVIIKHRRWYIVLSVMPMYAIFGGGSRTYLAIGLTLFLVLAYMVLPSGEIFILFFPVIVLGLGAVLMNANIMNKIISTLTLENTDYYQDILVKFTSGRSIFWVADMKAYFDSPFINQLLGSGFNFVYDVNKQAINNTIWAHNDFINILLNFGLVGLIVYIYVFLKMFQCCIRDTQMPKILKWVLFFVWFFNAFFNMFYTYSCASASYPFLVIGVKIFLQKRELRAKREKVLIRTRKNK